ncbi:MAG: hypothetical protein KAT70_02700 [Thermoplasmata archaeon]|nr:hypothetical protein [Thermoplasmata archaeon]
MMIKVEVSLDEMCQPHHVRKFAMALKADENREVRKDRSKGVAVLVQEYMMELADMVPAINMVKDWKIPEIPEAFDLAGYNKRHLENYHSPEGVPEIIDGRDVRDVTERDVWLEVYCQALRLDRERPAEVANYAAMKFDHTFHINEGKEKGNAS